MVINTPTKYFLVAGAGSGISTLNAFDAALMVSGVGNTNIVKLSSILPPHTQKIEPPKLPHGALVPVAYASITSAKPGEIISAAVAIAIPTDPEHAGLIMEYSAAAPRADIENRVVEMAVSGMAARGKEIERVEKISVEHVVEGENAAGAAFCGVVLWD